MVDDESKIVASPEVADEVPAVVPLVQAPKQERKTWLLLVLFGVVLIAGGLVYFLMARDSSQPATPKSSTLPAASIDPVGRVTEYVTKKYSSLAVSANQSSELAYKVAGYDFAVLDNAQGKPHSVAFMTTTSLGSTQALPSSFSAGVTNNLRLLGFTKVAAPVDVAKLLGGEFSYTYYERSNDVCMLSAGTSNQYASFVCGTKPQLNQIAQAAQPFAAGLAQARSTTVGQLGIGGPTIATNSKNPQYQHAIMSYSAPTEAGSNDQASAYFYKRTDETAWTYYTSVQEGLSCAVLAKDGIAAVAFSDVCSDSDTY